MPGAPEWVRIKLEQGQWPDVAPARSKGFIREGDRIRWRAATGQLEPFGGFERGLFSTSALYHGKARKVFEWQDNSGYANVFIGTNTSAWAVFDGLLYNITPIEEYAYLSGAIATIAGSNLFTVTKAAHGYVAGMLVRFPSGPTIDGVVLTSTYYEVESITTNAFTFRAGSNAVAGGSGLGGLLDMDVFLRPGLEFGLAGAGYGTGAYDVGTYGGNGTTTYRARVWTAGSLGEVLVACPSGGAVYEFGPSYDAAALAERVTNGSMGTSAGWTIGTSWTFDSGNAEMDASAITSSMTVPLSTQVTVPSGRFVRVRFTVRNYVGGTLTLKLGTNTLTPFGAAGSGVTANGRYTYEAWNTTATAQALSWVGSSNFTGSVAAVTAKVSDTLSKRTQAPANCNGILTTPAGHVMAWGCTDAATGVVDPMLVRSSDILNTTNWTPSFTSHARSFYLRNGNLILQGLNGIDGQLYFLTNTGLWEAAYVGLTDVFQFTQRRGNCGAFGVRGAVFDGSALRWMSNKKKFLAWDGSTLSEMMCPGEDEVFKNIAASQQDLCEAHNHTDGETWFIYPGASDGNEVSRYVFCATTNPKQPWGFGTYTRTAWGDGIGSTGYPLAAQSGMLYLHEKGDNNDGAGLAWYARARAIQIGDGNTTSEVSGFIPDTEDMMGPFTVNFIGYLINDKSLPMESGPQTITISTEDIRSFFVEGSIMAIEFAGDFPVKIGDPNYLVRDTGNPV
jgi:hypothetical protein